MDLHRVAQRVLHLFQPARVSLVDDAGAVQRIQADLGPKGPAGSMRIFGGLPVLGLFGFTSHPPRGSDLMTAFLGGDPSKGVVLGSNHQQSRLKNLGEGDAAIFDVRGAYVWLTAEGLVIDAAAHAVRIQNADTVTVVAATTVRVEAPQIECTGDVIARCDGDAVSLSDLSDAYNEHKHGGVQTGGGVSALSDHLT